MSSAKTAKKTSTSKKASAPVASKDKKAKSEESKEVKNSETATQDQSAAGDKKERQRRPVDKESVDTAFTELQTRISQEIEKLREAEGKVRGIKFLRSIGKAIKTLHGDTKRVMKLKKRNNRTTKVDSGFLRPVKISKELAQFTGWDANQTYLRRNVTKHICNYIKEHHLYDEKDKRNILCDEKLRTLLNYDAATVPMGKDGKPAVLNYFRLQKYLKPHFIKIEGAVKVEAVSVEPKADAAGADKPAAKTKPAAKKAAAKAAPAASPATKAKPAAKKVEDEDVEDEDLDD
jgi:chromatin remodeling complex protein RSC6